MSGPLTLGRDQGGLRHFLDGKPVAAGTPLELLMPDALWMPVRYESNLWGKEPEARLYFRPGGHARNESAEAYIVPSDVCFLRWPVTRGW